MSKLPETLEIPGFPITLVFGYNGVMYLSERLTGIIWQITGENFVKVFQFPVTQSIGHHEAGLLGIALDPDFLSNNFIYAYYTYGTNLDKVKNKVVKFKLGEKTEQILLDDIPAGSIHNGGVIAFGPDGTLYIGVGVSNEQKEKAQDINYLGGKVLRINTDGKIPDDNPFPNSPVYSLGHRNVFGLAFHPITKKLFICDVGPDKDDEINIIEAGGNYGWPIVTGKVADPRFINPIITYEPTITPTQCCFINNDFYFGSYNEGTVHKLTLDLDEPVIVTKDEVVYEDKPFGIVGVFASPEGEKYIATPNRITKINI